ncbi:hypothetical protein CHRY9390_01001 [Chryseobacterium aquaeductus]|uniref:Uncharacterized protein n=1 Tax=Chryseobacterium aquaeductus TaxID=2675056 RepID=A0A9N8MER8_9FLAO|nr:hypothetical protein [Chryseobacterium aquaeductus]CAA7330339.1 hypothetical protein CHRY9390_01001 [Chryseobacterium potabilaquae]CAD7802944.1 hypothetical protein CHRY9390_01001 [Chryseobacterium aquaeductus]
MKKIFLGFALTLATLSFAQQYPNNGYNDGYGENDDYYSDQDDQNYFPDDYYYNYPQDYYPQDYYQSYYNDYRNSIVNVNWNVFFQQNRLNRWQIDQILYLNNLYSNFSNWNNFYRYNPDRWYYDRFYAMERILGPRVFVVFQNNYYQGHRPIVYFQNYRRSYYTPRFRVMPRYRNVNINVYRVDRSSFRRNDNPTLNVVRNSGFRNGNNNSGGFRNQSNGVKSNNGNNGGFRNSNNGVRSNNGNNGVRSTTSNGGFRNGDNKRSESGGTRTVTPRSESSGTRGNGGFRSQQRSESSSPRIQKNTPRQENKRNEGRSSGGFRNSLVKN